MTHRAPASVSAFGVIDVNAAVLAFVFESVSGEFVHVASRVKRYFMVDCYVSTTLSGLHVTAIC